MNEWINNNRPTTTVEWSYDQKNIYGEKIYIIIINNAIIRLFTKATEKMTCLEALNSNSIICNTNCFYCLATVTKERNKKQKLFWKRRPVWIDSGYLATTLVIRVGESHTTWTLMECVCLLLRNNRSDKHVSRQVLSFGKRAMMRTPAWLLTEPPGLLGTLCLCTFPISDLKARDN